MIHPDHPLQRLVKSNRRVVFEPMLGEYVYAVDEVSNLTAKTPAERKAEERKRRADEGLAEVRGIWAPPADHPDVRAAARRAVERIRKKEKAP